MARTLLILLLVAGGSAAALAAASRVPASVREAPSAEDRIDPSNGSSFSQEEIARHGSYRRGAYLSYGLGTLLTIVILIVLSRGPLVALLERAGNVRGGWPVRVLLAASFLSVTLFLVALPMAYVRFRIDTDWGLATQTVGAWLADQGRSLGVGLVTGLLAALAFYGLVRWAKPWWLWGSATFVVLTVLLVFLYPLLIAPLFNRFTPLEDDGLRERVTVLAAEAGVPVKEVLVADASRRTTAENAYVAGIGASKQLVLYDTLLERGDDDATAFVVAHELGHRVHGHIFKRILLSSIGIVAGFLGLWWLRARAGPWQWAGADGVSDPRALPLILLFTTLFTIVSLPIQNALSRAHEREADATAFSLTEDPDAAVKLFRRLAYSNLADLRPPAALEWLLFTHPPIPERIEAAVAETAASP